MHADYGSPFKKKYEKLAGPKIIVTWPDLPRHHTSTLASFQEQSVGCFHVVPNSGLAPKAFHQIAIRAHLHLHCPRIHVRVSVWDPDRIVFTLHPRLGTEVIRVHCHFGPYLVATTRTGGFEHARFITSHVLGRPRKSLHVAMSSDMDVRDKNLGHGLGSVYMV